MEQLFTVWGETLDKEHVLDEYPRPLMVRDSYLNLNGYWDYAFTQEFVCPKEFDEDLSSFFTGGSIIRCEPSVNAG